MMEPVAWQWEEYFTEWGTGTNGEYKHSTMWDDEKPADHPDIRDVTPLVRLSDAEARIAELTKWRDEWKDMATELKGLVEEWQGRAEAAEALLKEAREALAGMLQYAGIIEERCGEAETNRARRALKEKP